MQNIDERFQCLICNLYYTFITQNTPCTSCIFLASLFKIANHQQTENCEPHAMMNGVSYRNKCDFSSPLANGFAQMLAVNMNGILAGNFWILWRVFCMLFTSFHIALIALKVNSKTICTTNNDDYFNRFQ